MCTSPHFWTMTEIYNHILADMVRWLRNRFAKTFEAFYDNCAFIQTSLEGFNFIKRQHLQRQESIQSPYESLLL